MGIENSLSFLNKTQIKVISETNPFLDEYFNSIKNYYGYITPKIFFSQILQFSLPFNLSNKIFKLFSQNGEMNHFQFSFFYSAFYSINTKNKILLISYIIFKQHKDIYLSKYQKRLKTFFIRSIVLYLFLTSPHFIKEITKSTSEGTFCSKKLFETYLFKEQLTLLNTFSIVKQYTNYENKANSDCEFICTCDFSDEIPENVQFDKTNPLYKNMQIKFDEIQKMNDGIFPLKIFCNLLQNCNISNSVIQSIGLYLQKITSKNILDYDTFYFFISKFLKYKNNHNQLMKFIFAILSYPNDFIEKEKMNMLIKEVCINSSNEKKNHFEGIRDIKIVEDIFLNNSSLMENIENMFLRVIVLPYKIFMQIPDNKDIEMLCVQNFLNGREDIDMYFKESLNTEETEFFCIQVKFLNEYIKFLSPVQKTFNAIRPVCDLLTISNDIYVSNLSPNAVYLKDFYIIPKEFYFFIKRLCKFQGEDIMVNKITIEGGDYVNLDNSNAIDTSEMRIKGKNNIIYEIELYKVEVTFVLACRICESIENSKGNMTLEEFLFYIEKNEGKDEYIKKEFISKITTFNKIKQELIKKFKINEYEESELFLYFNLNLIKEDILKKGQNFSSEGISKKCLCILDTKGINRKYYFLSLYLKAKGQEIKEDKDMDVGEWSTKLINRNPKKKYNKNFGMKNFNNSCYLNSILQLFLHIPEITNFFLNDFVKKSINEMSNKKKKKKSIAYQLYQLMDTIQKMNVPEAEKISLLPNDIIKALKSKNLYEPGKFQDASEFLQLLIEEIHKDTKLYHMNPKNKKEKIKSNLNEEERCKMFFAKQIRNEPSLINSMFSFILNSTVKCKKCGQGNNTYEICKCLYLPVPLIENFTLLIIFHPLPLSKKLYINENNKGEDDNTGCVPLKIQMQFSPKSKLEVILSSLIKMFKLENKEKINDNIIKQYTTLVMYSKVSNRILDINTTIFESVENNTQIHVFELLNSNGLYNLHNKQEPQKTMNLYHFAPSLDIQSNAKIISIISYNKMNKIPDKIDSILEYKDENIFYEYLIPIKHRYIQTQYPYLFTKYCPVNIDMPEDFILLNNNSQCNISKIELYNYILERYSYIISLSGKEYKPWWDENKGSKTKKCYPFILKSINKDTNCCAKCPWFRFCSGCAILPLFTNAKVHHEEINLFPNSILIVEWCSDLAKNGFIKEKENLILNYQIESNEIKDNNNNNNKPFQYKVNITKCLDMFFEEESLDSKIFCEKCNQLEYKVKHYSILNPPKFLTMVLKRFITFGFAEEEFSKNENFINFPLSNFTLNEVKYDCIGVINHIGKLSEGHYYAYIKVNNDTWVKFNDQKVNELKENEIITKDAYIIIYKENGRNKDNDFLFYNLINNIIKSKRDSFLFDGEPVWADSKFGYVKKSSFKDKKYLIDIQFEDSNAVYRREVVFRDITLKSKDNAEDNKDKNTDNANCEII